MPLRLAERAEEVLSDDLRMALLIEWLSWHGPVLHPYVDRTVVPLVSWHEFGMRLPDEGAR
jgi:hypothetical protein